MAAIGSSFVSRINLATGEVIPETKALAKGHYFDYIKFGVKANFKSLYFYSVSSIRVISTVMLQRMAASRHQYGGLMLFCVIAISLVGQRVCKAHCWTLNTFQHFISIFLLHVIMIFLFFIILFFLIFSGVLDILSGDLPKGSRIQTKHLEALIELHNVTGSFARNIHQLFSESDLRVLMDTLKAVYSPFESFKQRLGLC